MPLLDLGADVVAKTKAKSSVANAKWNAIKTLLNVTKLDADNIQDGAITEALLADALKQSIGIGLSSRGKFSKDEEETRTNTSYGLLATPDRVSNIVVPAGALVRLSYSALWEETTAGAARAAIFIDSNQLKTRQMNVAAPVIQAAGVYAPGAAGVYRALMTFEGGLLAFSSVGGIAHTSDVTTGQSAAGSVSTDQDQLSLLAQELGGSIYPLNESFTKPGSSEVKALPITVGGDCIIRNLAADTYDFSVQFKANPGSVTVKERRLTVEVVPF